MKQIGHESRKIDTEADYGIDSVLKVGAGYLATSWLFFTATIRQHDHDLIYAFGIFGMVVQIAFATIMHSQRNARCKALNLQTKGFFREAKGDVVVEILNWLLLLAGLWFLFFAIIGMISNIRGVTFHPVSL